MTSLLRSARLSLLCSLALAQAAQAQTPVPPVATPPAATQAPTPAQQAAQARTRLELPDPALSRLAVELSSAVGGRLYRCPPSLRLPPQAICLYARGESAALQSQILSRLGERVLGQWQARGPLLNLLLRPTAAVGVTGEREAANEYVALLDLGEGDHLLILGSEQASGQAAPAPAPQTPAEAGLYVVPGDLIGVVQVQRLSDQNYRLTPRGGLYADARLGSLEVVQKGTILPVPAPLKWQEGELYIPVSLLRSIGCVLTTTEGALTIACGDTSVGVTPRQL